MKDIKDYLHLYLGAMFIVDGQSGRFKLSGYNPYTGIQNVCGECVFDDLSKIKLILRSLSDMTEEEDQIEFPQNNRGEFIDMHWYPDGYIWLLSKGFDLFNLIEENLAIDKNSL